MNVEVMYFQLRYVTLPDVVLQKLLQIGIQNHSTSETARIFKIISRVRPEFHVLARKYGGKLLGGCKVCDFTAAVTIKISGLPVSSWQAYL